MIPVLLRSQNITEVTRAESLSQLGQEPVAFDFKYLFALFGVFEALSYFKFCLKMRSDHGLTTKLSSLLFLQLTQEQWISQNFFNRLEASACAFVFVLSFYFDEILYLLSLNFEVLVFFYQLIELICCFLQFSLG